jgi:Carboxypeptidase regulatory-like domain
VRHIRMNDLKAVTGHNPRVWLLMRLALAFLFTTFATCPSAHAQYSSGVDGTAIDSSGAGVPNATITLTNIALGVTKTVTANEVGYFKIDSIASGTYRLEVSSPNFKSWIENDLVIQVGQIRTVAPRLDPGAVNSEVTVSATMAALDLTSSATSSVIGATTIQQSPLVGQNVYGLAALAPGVTGPGLTSGDNFNNQYGIQINAAGQRQESNSFLIDGAFVDTPSLGGEASISPNPEIVQSIQINTNQFDAQKGRTSGANVQVFTNSGSNTFHGTGDYFFRNDSLSARTEFQQTVPGFTRQEGGASIGGPIIKNKLFFYGAIDVLRSSQAVSGLATVETQDFFNYVQQNLHTIGAAYLKAAAPVAYPTSGFTTVSQIEPQSYFPAPPGIPGDLNATGSVNYSYSIPRNGYQWNVRIDDYIGQHDRIYGTAMRTVLNSVSASGPRLDLNSNYNNNATFFNVGWTHTISSHLLNEMGVSYIRPSSTYQRIGTVGDTAFPQVTVVGVSSFYPYYGPWAQNTLGWREALTSTVKSHEIKVGAYLENIRENNTIPTVPSYSTNSLLDFIQDEPTSESAYPVDLATGKGVTPKQNYRQSYVGIFVQDDWKVSRNLTLSGGLRYDSQGHLAQILNPPFSIFRFGAGSTRAEQVANGFVTNPPNGSHDAIDHNVWAFSPRIGFSWDVFGTGRTALRGGFGVFSDRLPYRNFTSLVGGNLPNTFTPSLSVYSGQNPTMATCTLQGYTLDCPLIIPNDIQFDPHGGIVGQRANVGGFTNDTKMTQVENWTLSVQHQLSSNLVLEVNYSGMGSHHLPIFTDINRFGGDLVVNRGQLTRLNQSFGSTNFQTTDSNASGHFGSLMVTRQSSHGFTLRGIYTYGKALDAFSTAGNLQGACACQTTNVIQADNPNAQYGRADFDIRQQASFDGVWTLPNPWSTPLLKNTLGGWRLSGLALFQTGLPFTVYTSKAFQYATDQAGNVVNTGGDYNADGYNYDVPNVPGFGPHLAGQSKEKFLTGLFPVSAFPAPEVGQEGALGRNTYDQPGYANFNFNVEKLLSTPWFGGEKLNIELRGEFVNLFNRSNLSNVDGNLADGTFAQATNQLPPRYLQFHARFQF